MSPKVLNGKNLNKNNNNNDGGGKGGSGKAESGGMVSRRRILSRSRDDLHMSNGNEEEQQQNGHNSHNNGGMRGHPMRNVANYFRDEEDVWYLKEKLYRVSECTKIIQEMIFSTG